MNKIICIILLISLSFAKTFAQSAIDGTYCDDVCLYCLKIKDGKFNLVDSTYGIEHLIIRHDKEMTYGSIKKIDKNFYEINSDDEYYYNIHRSIDIKQFFDPNSSPDSILIKFESPFTMHERAYRIELYASNSYSVDNINFIKMKNKEYNNKEFAFAISILNPSSDSFEGCYFGRLYFNSYENYTIEKNSNTIIVRIPELTISYFERYYIKGEYIRVKGNKLIWRGKEFKKQ